jgi:hypothetical protein
MLRTRLILPALALCLFVYTPGTVQATSGIRNSWRALYDPCPPLYDQNCTVCHPSTSGPSYNSYGEDIRYRIADLNMSRTEAFVDAESVDSDGDGYTNGQEITVDCTFPWDAADRGTVAANPSSWDGIKALYR